MTNKQELKDKIIKEQLPYLSIDPLGYYVDSEELNKKTYNSYEEYYYVALSPENIDLDNILSKDDFKEIKKKLIANIKENINEWNIEQEGTLTIIKNISGKKHYQRGFEEEEWKGIENSLLEKQLINNNFFNNLTKSSLYGGSGGNDFNDLESIKSQTPNNQSIKSIKLKKITIHSCSDIIQFLQFTYQVETDQKTLEIQGQEIGTKDDGQNRWWGKCDKVEEIVLADSETITKLGGSFCDRFADPMLGGLSIKTSENKEYNLGCSSLGSNSFNLEVGNDIIFHGNHGDLIDGVGVYSSKFVKKLNKEKNISKSKLLFDKRKNINPNFTKELTQQWAQEGFTEEQTRNWLKVEPQLINHVAFFAWLRDEIEAEPSDLLELSDNDFGFLFEQYQKWIKNYVWCDICKKRIKKGEMFFNDREKGIIFCSSICKLRKNEIIKESKDDFMVESTNWILNRFTPEQLFLELAPIGYRIDDGSFCAWLRDEIGIEPKYLEYEQLNSLREQYEEYLKKETKCSKCFKETTKGRLYLFCIKTDLDFCSEFCHSESMIDLKKYLTNDEEKTFQYFQQWGRLISICEDIVDWFGEKISLSDYKWIKNWKDNNFTATQTRKWKEVGLENNQSEYARWLMDIKGINPQIYSKYNKDDKEESWNEYVIDEKIDADLISNSSMVKCEECQKNTAFKIKYDNFYTTWCKPCNSKHFQEEFKNWTSGSEIVDKFIQKCQLEANNTGELIQWIPYENFTNIEYLAEGGFGKVYKANLLEKPILQWDAKKKAWQKDDIFGGLCALKVLKNSQNITANFLQEINSHKLVDKNFVIGFFGISQDPDTKDYIMVMEYLKDGNLRNFLQKNYRKLSLEIKFSKLITLSNGLNYIHKKGLIHKDFHPGNVLVNISQSTKNPSSFLGHLFITDLGLCKPVNERNTDEKIYGVLPYVAPEVLTGQPYTQASDVYSFGMIMYEIMTGLQPYQGILYDKTLASKVCQGLRPDLDKISLPQLLKDLINKCWEADSLKRLKAKELEDILRIHFFELNKPDREFYKQCIPTRKTELEIHTKAFSDLHQKINGWTKEVNSYEQWRAETQKLFLDFCTKENCDKNKKESREKFDKLLYPTNDHSKTHKNNFSTLLNFPNLPQSQNNYNQIWKTTNLLELEINGIEEKINILKEESINGGQKDLLKNFIKSKKQSLKDKENQELEDKVWDLEDKLEAILSREKIDELILYCEKLIELEKKLESEKSQELQSQIEISIQNNHGQ